MISDDLQIDEPDCNGTWTLIKIISVYTPIDEKDNYDFYVKFNGQKPLNLFF